MLRRNKKKMRLILDAHTAQGVEFRMKVTNQRTEIKSKLGAYMNKESEFPMKELNFIKSVKQYIIKHQLQDIIPDYFKTDDCKKEIKYYSYNNRYKSGHVINKCVELDMKSAYWEMLFKLLPLPQYMYEKGNDPKRVSKKSRLAAVGALAKVTEIIDFDGEKYLPSVFQRSLFTEHIWNAICFEVGKIMTQVANECGKDFIFFWVDAMFVDARAVETVKRIFTEHGFRFSVDPCKFIKFNDNNLIVKGKGKWVEFDGQLYFSTEREFPYKPNGTKEIFEERAIIKIK